VHERTRVRTRVVAPESAWLPQKSEIYLCVAVLPRFAARAALADDLPQTVEMSASAAPPAMMGGMSRFRFDADNFTFTDAIRTIAADLSNAVR
jgi:hypothetical protein